MLPSCHSSAKEGLLDEDVRKNFLRPKRGRQREAKGFLTRLTSLNLWLVYKLTIRHAMTFQIRKPELYWEPITDTVTVPFFP